MNEQGSWENSKDVESRENNYFELDNKTNNTKVLDANHAKLKIWEDIEKTATRSWDGVTRMINQSWRMVPILLQASDHTVPIGTELCSTNVVLQQTDQSESSANQEQQHSDGTPLTTMKDHDATNGESREALLKLIPMCKIGRLTSPRIY